MTNDQEPDVPDAPPILGSWRRMYLAVLVLHLLLIILLYFFSRHYA